MDPNHYQRVKRAIAAALERPRAEREAAIAECCATDASLEADVRAGLAADAQAQALDFLEAPTDASDIALVQALLPSELTLLGPLGRGGMGRVFLANRRVEGIQRLVAVKILAGADPHDPAAVERFRRECQILADLDHPNIVRFLDAGHGLDGRPYLVMDHAPGETLDVWHRTRQPSLPQRLRVFRAICLAVQHAHGQLVVHRDLKPQNVLVGPDGTPRVLDFGVAKLISEAGVATQTAIEHRALTYQYASPEQLRGRTIGTASDVYSLGVILHRLISGGSPYRDGATTPPELARAICEDEPLAPSVVARARTAPRTWRSLVSAPFQSGLSRDLDEIVLKALRKEPAQRYGSAEQLGADVQRALDGLPVTARRGGRTYRLRKLVWRNRWVVLALSIMTTLAGAYLLEREQRLQQTILEGEKTRQVARFLTNVLAQADPQRARGKELTVREAVDRSVADLRDPQRIPEAMRVTLLTTVGEVYRRLGQYDSAAALLLEAESLARQSRSGREHTEALRQLAAVRLEQGAIDEAEAGSREVARAEAQAWGPESLQYAWALEDLGAVLLDARRNDAARETFEASLALRRGTAVASDPSRGSLLNNLALVQSRLGNLAQAEASYREALAHGELWSNAPLELANTQDNLAKVLAIRGNIDEAERLNRISLSTTKDVVGEEHPAYLFKLGSSARLMTMRGNYREAVLAKQHCLAKLQALYPDPANETVAHARTDLALALRGQARFDEAEALARESYRVLAALSRPGATTSAAQVLALVLIDRGELDAASDLLASVLPIVSRDVGANNFRTEELRAVHAMARVYAGDLDRAADIVRSVEVVRSYTTGPNPRLLPLLTVLGEARIAERRSADAAMLLGEAQGIAEQLLPETDWQRRYVAALHRLSRAADARSREQAQQEALALLGERFGDTHPRTALLRAAFAAPP